MSVIYILKKLKRGIIINKNARNVNRFIALMTLGEIFAKHVKITIQVVEFIEFNLTYKNYF